MSETTRTGVSANADSFDAQMAQVMVSLEMLSHGSTSAWNASGGGGVPDSRILTMRGEPPHLYWRERFNRASTPRQQEDCVNGAQLELEAWRGGNSKGTRTVSLSDEELLREQILVEGKGWPAQDVARRCKCTETLVRKVRLRAELENAPVVVALDQRERVRSLAADNLSERQIEFITKVPKTSIRRILRRAA